MTTCMRMRVPRSSIVLLLPAALHEGAQCFQLGRIERLFRDHLLHGQDTVAAEDLLDEPAQRGLSGFGPRAGGLIDIASAVPPMGGPARLRRGF